MRPATLTVPVYPIPSRRRPRIPPMAEDDPRHGTYAGAVAHWRAGEKTSEVCIPCRDAGSRHRKTTRWRRDRGVPSRIPVIGYSRRLRALQRLGWSMSAIAAETGLSVGQLNHVALPRRDPLTGHVGEWVTAPTALNIRRAYDLLSMRVPTGKYVLRVQRHAARNGWPPPLAWEAVDIDNPGIEPWGWDVDLTLARARAASAAARTAYPAGACLDREQLLEEAVADGIGISEACRRTGATRSALQKWCGRKGLHHLYRQLAAREDGIRGSQMVDPRPATDTDRAA